MRRFLPLLLFGCVLVPGSARADACSPLSCAASQVTFAHGTLLGYRTSLIRPMHVVDLRTGKALWTLPGGLTGGDLLVHQSGRTITWYDVTRGTRVDSVALRQVGWSLQGVSQDGTRAVLSLADGSGWTFLIVSPQGQRTVHIARGEWGFDALRGDKLFLIQYLKNGAYEVRLAHVDTGRLVRQPLKDPKATALIWGSPFSRVSSPDGRYVFTLYLASNGAAMVHELDLENATARCVDLPGTGNYGSASTYSLSVSKDGRTLWAVSPGYGRAVAIDVRAHRVREAFTIALGTWNYGNATTAALSPDGSLLAIADEQDVAVLDLHAQHVVSVRSSRAVAVGYSPDGARLWKF